MKKRVCAASVFAVVIAVVLVIPEVSNSQTLPGIVQPPIRQIQSVSAIKPLAATISRLRGPEIVSLIGRDVTIEGFYYNGSIPMIIDDFNRVKMDMPLPQGSYVPVTGNISATLRSGDRVSASGTLIKPSSAEPVHLRREPSALRVTNPAQLRTIPNLSLGGRLPEVHATAGGTITVTPGNQPPYRGTKYAVLIAGGASYADNHIRYWNDLKTMYNILKIQQGYAPANIYVLYADGYPREQSVMPVNYSAKRANITAVFNKLASLVGADNTVYVMLNDHGGPGKLCLWYESMTAAEFAAEVNKVSAAKHTTIQMKQCYSGCFVGPLTGPRRIVMASCKDSEVSWAHESLQFGEFTYWYLAALTGSKPDGSGSVNADTDNDHRVSVMEAYNFARSHDTRPESPIYEDNGTQPGFMGFVPNMGEGVLGLIWDY